MQISHFHSFATGEVVIDQSEWKTIVELAVKWHFNHIKKDAIQHLQYLGPITGIELGRRYGHEDWLRKAFQELVLSWDSIDVTTSQSIGAPTHTALLNLREEMWRYRVESYRNISRDYYDDYGRGYTPGIIL